MGWVNTWEVGVVGEYILTHVSLALDGEGVERVLKLDEIELNRMGSYQLHGG